MYLNVNKKTELNLTLYRGLKSTMLQKIALASILMLWVLCSVGYAGTTQCADGPCEAESETTLKFGAVHKSIHTLFPKYCDAQQRSNFYEALNELNIDIIQFYIFPDEWNRYKSLYLSAVNKIRNGGREVYIGYKIGESHLYKKYNSFNEYTIQAQAVIYDIVETLHPEYFSIVVEPAHIETNAALNVSDDDWVAHVDRVAQRIKEIDPNVVTIATTQAFDHEHDLFRRFAALESLDKVGINPYANRINESHVVDLINEINAVKPVWFTEVWVSPGPAKMPSYGYSQEDIKALTEDYLYQIVAFAKENNIEYLAPYFTEHFFTYSLNRREQLKAIKNDTRTQAYYIFQELTSQ